MEYKLEFRPTERKEGMKYKTILLTDIMLHTSPKKTTTFGSKLRNAFSMFNKPGRIYQPLPKIEAKSEEPNTFKIGILNYLQNDPNFIQYVTEEREKGFEVVIQIPKVGLPIFPGKDTVEFIKSKNGQRVLRGLAKNKPTV